MKEQYADEELHPENLLPALADANLLRYNADFIARDTYAKVFDRLRVNDGTMLDLGAGLVPLGQNMGSSSYTEELAKRHVHIIPVDRSQLAIHTWKVAPRVDDGETSYASPIQADVNNLPIKDASVDGAISINYLNSFEKKARESVQNFLREAYRVIKPGGFLIISTFGYTCSLSSRGELSVNNRIPFDEFVTSAMVEEEARKIGFAAAEKIPLDKADIDRMRARWLRRDQDRGEDVTAILMEEPIGLLLRK